MVKPKGAAAHLERKPGPEKADVRAKADGERIWFYAIPLIGTLIRRWAEKREKIAEANRALFAAVKANDIDEINRALANGANINSRDEDRYTPLMCACKNGAPREVVRHLLEKGADADLSVYYENTKEYLTARTMAANAKNWPAWNQIKAHLEK